MATSTILEDTEDTRNGPPATGWHCPAERTLQILAGKWRPMIIYWLLPEALRFNELQRRLKGITHRTLSKTLKEMEVDGLLARKDYREIPPRVDYSLTPKGESLKFVLIAMEEWAREIGTQD
ncbi:winged helix-turn-helix transcriptional regulator [Sphingomonas japonica]|uniref:DNA-binding HxlR family transcriptional regulator n=1 Tax=Sphingomonas japonica TaxID=511662 RepID=A0ABX0U7C6_9SPHN|nr:helix-turn-helix domain-containing protein [Sphingomonas japonica]NIJ25237.1 DNA-binding HxlR family transcriptional regulator [Sphingomonas japonica]